MQMEHLERRRESAGRFLGPRSSPPVAEKLGAGYAPTPCVAVHVENTQVPRFAARLGRLQLRAPVDLKVEVVAEHSPIVYARADGGSNARDANELLFKAVGAEMGDGRRGGDSLRRIAAHRVYRLDWSCAEAHWVPLAEALRVRKHRDVFRVVAYPRVLQLRLTEMLSAEGFRVHPTHFSAELHAVAQPALSPFVHFGVVSRCSSDNGGSDDSDSVAETECVATNPLPLTAGEAPSRAYFKMQESLRSHLDGLVVGAHALDIGASPVRAL